MRDCVRKKGGLQHGKRVNNEYIDEKQEVNNQVMKPKL